MNELTKLFNVVQHHKKYRLVHIEDGNAFIKAINEHGPLAVSIAKWQAIINALAIENNAVLDDDGSSTCGLCVSYLHRQNNCFSCPVYRNTGKELCVGTPYPNYLKGEIKDQLEQAKAELAYLESLAELVVANPKKYQYAWAQLEENK